MSAFANIVYYMSISVYLKYKLIFASCMSYWNEYGTTLSDISTHKPFSLTNWVSHLSSVPQRSWSIFACLSSAPTTSMM